jgi:hypothetical protein
MRRFYDDQSLLSDVGDAIERALAAHGLSPFALLGVTTVIEAIASPLKYQIAQGALRSEMGRLGVLTYAASRLPRAVGLIQNPNSQVVSPLMEAITAALIDSKVPLQDSLLERNALRLHLQRPRLSVVGVRKVHNEDASLAPALLSACRYLEEGDIIQRTDDGRAWRLRPHWET